MSAPFEDFYATLGVARDAKPEEISRAYRKLSLAVHPDRYKGPDPEGALAEFHKLTKAREVLDDEKAKAAFDALLRAKEAHKLRQEAQDAGRRKLREDLEAREAAAARGPARAAADAAMAERQKVEQQEARARAELQRELERLHRTGRLSGTAAKPRPAAAAPAAAPATAASATDASATAASASCVKLSLRWSAASELDAESLGALLREHGAPPEMVLAVVGQKAVLELSAEHAKHLLRSSDALSARGIRVHRPGGVIAGSGSEADSGGSAGSATSEAPLPPGWKQLTAPDGKPYYYEVNRRKTQWKRPLSAAVSARPASELEDFESQILSRLQQASKRQRVETSDKELIEHGNAKGGRVDAASQ